MYQDKERVKFLRNGMKKVEKEILVVFTGGTISSQVQKDTTIGVSEKIVWQLIEEYEKSDEVPVKFHVIQPFTMLSENCIPNNWQMLLDVLQSVDFSKYRGVIVTHGTDTLCYTSALLGYVFGHLQIPMVIIGSNYPLADKRSNGRANFFAAVRFIREDIWKGVYVIFQNKKKENMVYLPTRLLEADSYEDEFAPFGGVELGWVTADGFVYWDSKVNPLPEELLMKRESVVGENITFEENVAMILPYPGMDYRMFSFEKKPAAILHGLYHSATACIKGEQYSILEFLKKCKEQEIPVYVFSVKPEEKQYETGNALLQAGAIPLYNMTGPAAYMKLLLAYNQRNDDAEKIMEKQWYFENLP